MSLCDRLIGGAVDGLDVLTSFWQTPREVEWAKAAADGLAEREAEEEVAEPGGWWRSTPESELLLLAERVVVEANELSAAISAHFNTSATTPGAVDGPAEGEPPEPSAGVGPNSPKWIRDLIEATEDYVGAPRGSLSSPLESADLAEPVADSVVANERDWFGTVLAAYARGEYPPIADVPGLRWRDCAPSAEVEPPASAPSAESPAPEFDWVTTAIPVIAGVLAEHQPTSAGRFERAVFCGTTDEFCGEFADWDDWRNHVAPRIAVALQTDLLSTIYEDTTFAINAFSGDRPRPLADFPKHQK